MNPIILLIGIGAILGVIGFFMLPINLLFFGGLGVVISIMGVLIHKMVLVKSYPVEIRIWEKRFGKPTIVEMTRGKRVSRDNIEKYECVNRISFKAPDREYIISSPKGNFIDLFRLSSHQYCILTPDFDFEVDEKTGKIDFGKYEGKVQLMKIIPDDDIRTLADLTIKTIEVTKPIEDRLMKFMPIMIIAVTGIILMIMLVAFMQYFPDFVKEVTSVMSAQIEALKQTTAEFSSAVNNYTIAVKGGSVNPPPPY